MTVLNNVDEIYNEFSEKLQKSKIIRKLDGITLECELKSKRTKLETAKTEIEKLCEEYELLPISIEQNSEDKQLFVLQFPDLNTIYTDTEKQTMYNVTFKWLLDNAIEKTKMNISGLPTKITKQLLKDSRGSYVKVAIDVFYNSAVNKYKQSIDMYSRNTDYIKSIENLYLNYLDTYCEEKGIK